MPETVRVTFQFAVGQRVRWAGEGPDDRPYVVVWRRYTEGLLRFLDYGLGDGTVPAAPGILTVAYEPDLEAVEETP